MLKIIDAIDNFIFMIARIVFFLMVFLVSFDSLGRFFFNQPIIFAFKLTEHYLMPVIIFLSISYTWKLKGHIRISLFYERFPERIKNIVSLFGLLAGSVFFLAIAYEGYLVTYEAWINNYVAVGIYRWPTYLTTLWIPIGAGMMGVRLILEFIIKIGIIMKEGLSSTLSE